MQRDTYKAIKPDFHKLSAVTYSDYLALNGPIPKTVLNADVNTVDPVPADCTIMAVAGIEFFQMVGENYYAFASGNALKVVDAENRVYISTGFNRKFILV